MSATKTRRALLGCTCAAALTGGCGAETDLVQPEPPVDTADTRLLALSTYSAPVGTTLEVFGSGFPTPRNGRIELAFDGAFVGPNGARESVSFQTPARRVDASTLRWTSFGPYKNPFSTRGAQIGRFQGSVAARVIGPDGRAVGNPSAPLDIDFEVTPSIIVHELQPITASCNGGVVRALGGASYRLEVEAVGFTPVTFTYTISAPGVGLEPVSIRHIARGARDVVGDDGTLVFPRVPENRSAYSALLTVEARDAEGRVRQSAFAISVHRPIEVFYNGNVEVAEVMAPEPVTACIPGGVNGRNANYAESQSETRSRAYDVSWNQSWLQSHTVSSGSSETIGLTETNGVGFSTTDGRSFNWSLGTEVEGSFGIDKLVSVGVGASSQVGGDVSRSNTNSRNRQQGINESTTTTETESIGESMGGSQGESFSWSVSSSEVISRGFGGRVIAGTYGVFYRQTLRLLRRAALVAYNQCGYATLVGEVDFTDWTWSPDLALGNSCPPLPESNLPPAECIVPPCTGE
jgi:hypothetical protein